jgi:ATP-dependent Zn protease
MEEIETAHHEAGHAVMGCVVGRLPLSVTIVRGGPVAGQTDFEPGVPAFGRRYLDESAPKRAYTEQRVLTELAGTAAHDIFQPGRPHDIADETDLRITRALISELVSWQDQEDYLFEAQAKTGQLLKSHWRWVEVVARALLERKTLSREEILSLRPKSGTDIAA